MATKKTRKVKGARKARKKVVKPRARAKAPARKRMAAAGNAAMRGEFAALWNRLDTIGGKLAAADPVSAREIEAGPWAAAVADLDAWALKHKVAMVERTIRHGQTGGLITPRTHRVNTNICPPVFIQPLGPNKGNQVCTFRRHALFSGDCIYRCSWDPFGIVTI